eukprot:jgi/Mesvir1/5415/Mv15480-RA.2
MGRCKGSVPPISFPPGGLCPVLPRCVCVVARAQTMVMTTRARMDTNGHAQAYYTQEYLLTARPVLGRCFHPRSFRPQPLPDLLSLPPPPPPSCIQVRDELARRELKSQLWQAAAGLDRGMAASSAQREQVEALVLQLEAINPTPAPCQSAVPSIDGTWHLLYSSVQEWRSSPFFWALQGVLDEILGEEEAAQPLYSFLNSMRQPLQVTLGPRIAQHVDAARGLLVSEMDVALLTALADGIRLRLTTTSTLAVTGPATAEVTVRTTQLRDCNVAPLLDRLPIPVEPLLTLLGSWGSLRGSTSRKHTGAATITMYTPYLDEDLRIIRTPDGEVFVYHRDLAPASEGPSSIERLVG